MRKKILVFLFVLFSSISLVSCGSSSQKTPDIYEAYTIEPGEEELLGAISKVENSHVILVSEGVLSKKCNFISSFIYKYDGTYYYALSNYISGMESTNLYIRFSDNTLVSATLLGYDSVNNLSCVRFKSNNELTILEIKDDSTTLPGTMVFSLASAIATGKKDSYSSRYEGIIYSGIISGYDGRLIKHTALPSDDFLGSPLIDYDGNFVGINVLRETSEEVFSFNFAISGPILNTIVSDLELCSGGNIKRPNFSYSGMEKINIIDKENQGSELPSGINYAILVVSVSTTNSFYGKLKKDDLIYMVNDKIITSPTDFENEIALSKLGNVSITIYRYENNKYNEYKLTA